METSSVNFDLLASTEQNARIGTFAGLLNSLNFPIQIVILTQRTDTSKYIALLDDYKNRVGYEPIREQVTIYQEFINNLTSTTQILDKHFFAVIPTLLTPAAQTSGLKQFFGGKAQIVNIREIVAKAQLELQPKRDHLIKQFGGMGLAAKQLRNDELIKLYYSIYEPGKVGLEVMNLRQDALEGSLVTVQDGFEATNAAGIVASPTDALDKPPVTLST